MSVSKRGLRKLEGLNKTRRVVLFPHREEEATVTLVH